MNKLYFVTNKKSKDTVTRTIRISGEAYDKVSKYAEKNNTSFNSIVNQCLEYALQNIEENK